MIQITTSPYLKKSRSNHYKFIFSQIKRMNLPSSHTANKMRKIPIMMRRKNESKIKKGKSKKPTPLKISTANNAISPTQNAFMNNFIPAMVLFKNGRRTICFWNYVGYTQQVTRKILMFFPEVSNCSFPSRASHPIA